MHKFDPYIPKKRVRIFRSSDAFRLKVGQAGTDEISDLLIIPQSLQEYFSNLIEAFFSFGDGDISHMVKFMIEVSTF